MGLCMGVQPLMAYYYGAGDMRRIKEVVMKLFILTLGIGVVFGAVGMLGSKALVGLFIRDLEVVELGQKIVCIQLLSAPFVGIYYIGQNFMQATGSALMATITSVLRQGVLLIPLLYIMNAIMKMMGIPTAHVMADFISIVVTSVLTVIIYKKSEESTETKEGGLIMKYFCNPVNINYRYQFNMDPREGALKVAREAADPSMIYFKGKYYIFASMNLSVWVSEDLAHWESHRLPENLPLYDYAPDVRVMGEYVYFSASRRGEVCNFYRTKDILNGEYEEIPGTFDFWDPNLFVDDDKKSVFLLGMFPIQHRSGAWRWIRNHAATRRTPGDD